MPAKRKRTGGKLSLDKLGLSKIQYLGVARALRRVRDSYAPTWDANLFRACDDNAHALARTFKKTNPHFQHNVFLNACGVPADRQKRL